MSKIVGIGGIFLKVQDKAAARRWYVEVLGLDLASWGGVKFEQSAPGAPGDGPGVFTLFASDTDHFAPSTQPVMINLRVDDLDGVLARAADKGVTPLGRSDDDTFGRFAWLLDPDGFKIELWEPPAKSGAAGG